MKILKLIYLFILVSINLYAINPIYIDEKTTNFDILSKSYIYIDDTHKLTNKQVLKKEFKRNNKETISLGINTGNSLWIKFDLKNTSNRNISKIIEFANHRSEEIYLYYDKKIFKE